jgi:hypothetical protein
MQSMPSSLAATASCTTGKNSVVLKWGKYSRTIPLDPRTNVGTFRLAPGISKYEAFMAEIKLDPQEELHTPLCYATESSNDNDDSVPNMTDFKLDQTQLRTTADSDLVLTQPHTVSAEFLQYHQKFGHLSPKKIKLMAQQGLLPPRLAKCPIPLCTACLYGKASKQPWRHKPSK